MEGEKKEVTVVVNDEDGGERDDDSGGWLEIVVWEFCLVVVVWFCSRWLWAICFDGGGKVVVATVRGRMGKMQLIEGAAAHGGGRRVCNSVMHTFLL